MVCHEDFLKSIFSAIDSYDRTIDIITVTPEGIGRNGIVTDDVRSMVKSGMVAWLVGHEMGHAILHRPKSDAKKRPLYFSGYTYDVIEREADVYVSGKMGTDINIATVFKLSLGEFLQHEYRRHIEENATFTLPDGSNATAREYWHDYRLPLVVPIKVKSTYTQYPLLLRVLGMLITMSEEIEGLDETGFYKSLNKNVYPSVDASMHRSNQ